MLKRINIQNYAIIDEIGIDFASGLNIITGETGAGKSIVMGALSLVLGDRADTSVLLNREKKCFVEAIFKTEKNSPVMDFLRSNDLDPDEELIIRREISATGKSRAFINDTPVNLEQLRQISGLLVDLHRQFDTLELGQEDFQRQVLDALAGTTHLLQQYREVYKKMVAVNQEAAALIDRKTQFNKEYDYNSFLFNELDEAGFAENEIEESEAALQLQSNAEGIKNALARVGNELTDGEQPMVQQLKILHNLLQTYVSYHPSLQDVCSRIQSAQIELQDVAGEIEKINDHVQLDPQKAEQLSERVSTGYKLLKKHGVKTTNELIAIKKNLEEKLQAVISIDEEIAAKQKLSETLLKQAADLASSISAKRKKQAAPFETSVNKLLVQVGMPNARLKVTVAGVPMHANGMDEVDFSFDANKSNRFEPVRKVASGGELSRLMLCIKSLVAQSVDLPSMIFDEIDTGISGEAAKQVGIIMKQLAKSRQLIAITHQPQIAGKADTHYLIFKEPKGSSITTRIRKLNTEERISTIAKMLGGEKPTAAALENAREMVMN